MGKSARWHYRRIRKRYGLVIAAFLVSVVVIILGQPVWGAIGLVASIGLAGPSRQKY